jgi:transcriptional regulator with XRE-family HTH domain
MKPKLYEILKLARESAGLSLTQAADLTQISKLRIAILESQTSTPTEQERHRLANTYGVSYHYLRTGETSNLNDVLARYHRAPNIITAQAIEKFYQVEAHSE